MVLHSPKPVLKWPGGKRQLLPHLMKHIPNSYGTYYEPFVGGGALLFALQPSRAVVGDSNPQLINLLRRVRDNTDELIAHLEALDSQQTTEDLYYANRDAYNAKIAEGALDVECAALMLWLNRRCFNGLYRTNRNGLFNVPFGIRFPNVTIPRENLLAVAHYLSTNDVTLACGDFEDAVRGAQSGDLVFFDPPYVPVSSSANFTKYTKDGFPMEDHRRVATVCHQLSERGCHVIATNNDVPLVRELYADFTIAPVSALRSISAKAGARKSGKEVIISNV